MTFQCIKNLLFPRVRRTLKDFVFGICVLRGVMQYTKGAPHLLNPFVHFFCVAQKKWTLSERCSIRGRSDLRTSVYVRKRAPLRGACRANSSHRLCRMLRSPVASRFLQTSCLRLMRLDGGSPTALVSDCVGLLKACLFILF